MSSHRIVVQPLSRFLASRISAATAAVRQTSSISSTPSSSVVAAMSSGTTIALPPSLSLDYQRRGISISSTTKKGISIDSHYRSSRQTPLSTLPTWRMNNLPSTSSSLSSPSHHHHRRTFATSTTSLQTSSSATTEQPAAAANPSEDGDECPPWQNPLHHNNPEYTRVLAEEFAPGEEMPIAPLPPFDESDDDDKVSAPPHLHGLAEEIVRLNMLEVKELVDRIGDHFGFTDDDDYMDEDVGGGDGGGEKVEEVVEKTVFDLKLTGFDAKAKIKVIKEIRGLTSLGLKEAKELVEGAPTTVKKDIKMEEAEEIKAKLEAVGATVEIV
mmetsp:Transcript_16592/g.25120  ORF Transcript_16592/g.25120 Transcript_16592/m.25120 type:complete len:327 (+) Transcript_16592:44-1024(+)